MDLYLTAVGWWNLIGSFLLLLFLNPSFGNRVLVGWSQIFTTKFELDYYGKLWLFWAAGLNIFFGLINILAAEWQFTSLMKFMLWTNIIIYVIFMFLGFWGVKTKRCGAGIYVAFAIFTTWIIWGIRVL